MHSRASFSSPSNMHSKHGRSYSSAREIADFLQTDVRMAALLPAATRITALQKDCMAILPAIFNVCSVLQLEAGRLTIATPSSALAAKLKQQLPKLQEVLIKHGWQVSAIRIKVQPGNIPQKTHPVKQLVMPQSAMSALEVLHDSLEDSARNESLRKALLALVQRHRSAK